MSLVPTSIRQASAVLCRYPNSRCLHDISTTATTLLERKISLKTRPDLNIVQAGHIGANGAPSPDHTVLLMPGAIGTAMSDFRLQLEQLPALLPAHWSLVAWDPPGYGKSRPPQRTFPLNAPERDAQAASELMEALGCKRYSVMGWSGGGVSGMHLTAQRSQVVRKLVTWGAPAIISQHLADVIESKSY